MSERSEIGDRAGIDLSRKNSAIEKIGAVLSELTSRPAVPYSAIRSRISCRKWASSALYAWRLPPLSALRLAQALPSAVRGPVDRSHAFQR